MIEALKDDSTRAVLEVLAESRLPVGIITKNALVTRDLDILKPIAERGLLHVSISLTTLDHALARKLDPRASSPTARLQAMQSRTQQAADYFKSALRLRPVGPGGITIDPSILANFNLDASRTVHNADLVLIMTARPSPNSPVAGFASCLQMDQFHRCTVAWFNW